MNLPLTPFIDKWGVFKWVVIYSEAYLQKHLLSGKWGLSKCRESLIQGLKKGTAKASASQCYVPAEYQGTVEYSICVSTGCCGKLPQTRWHKLCVCALTVPEVISVRTSSLGWEHHVVRARTLGETASWPVLVSRAAWLAVHGSRPHPLPQPRGFSRLLLLYCHVPFSSSVCGVRSPLASLLEQWGHWGLTQMIPISRSLITSGKYILWCNIHKNLDPVMFEALYSLYILGYNVLSAQCQALLGGWVGPYGIWKWVCFFISWLIVIYTKTINMHHKCTLEHWNTLYKETNYQTLFTLLTYSGC